MEEFQPGDVVVLKSGGPQMTVASVGEYLGEPTVWCEWFDGKKPYKETFSPAVLKKYSSSPVGSTNRRAF